MISTAIVATVILSLVPKLPAQKVRHYAAVIANEAERQEVDPFLITSLIFNESTFDANAVHPVTLCAGLMMIAPVHHTRKRGPDRGGQPVGILRPSTNVRVGVSILRRYLNQCYGDALCAVTKYHGASKPDGWARKVIADAEHLRHRYGGPPDAV